MITEKTLNKYKEYIGKTIGTLKVEDIDLSIPNRIYFICTCTVCGRKLIKRIYNNHKESSTTISKESTSKVIVDGSGEHLYVR